MSKSPSTSLPASSPQPEPVGLEQVHQAFSDWRASGGTHRTPVELQRQAAALLDQHTAGRICKVLRLDHRRLKRWREQLLSSSGSLRDSSAEFVEVPAGTARSLPAVVSASGLSLTLTRQDIDGSTVSISGHLEASGWRWALGLLREPGR